MKKTRILTLFLMLALAVIPAIPQSAGAQTDGPAVTYRGVSGQLSPNRGLGIEIKVTNIADTAIVVNGVSFVDVIDVTADQLELCPRVWFGDAGYSDRPRGESETNPPVPPYPLQQPQMPGPVTLGPGESFVLPVIELYMIQAAPNVCQSRRVSPITEVDWHFVPTYGTVAGTITDSASGLPVDSATVTISGTTEGGQFSEDVPVDASGNYVSTTLYQTGSELTVSASAPAYASNSQSIVVDQGGGNIVNLALDPVPLTGTVSGTITDVDTNDVIPNAAVTLTGTDTNGAPITDVVTSDADGEYFSTVQFPVDAPVTISVAADGYQEGMGGIEAVVEGVNTANVALTSIPVPVASIAGTITDVESGSPIAGATVIVSGTDASGNPVSETLTTIDDGAYASALQLQIGSDVIASAEGVGYQSQSSTTVLGNEGVTTIDLALVPVAEGEEPVPAPTAPPMETPVPTDPPVESPVPTDPPMETPVAEETVEPTVTPAPAETMAPTSAPAAITGLPSTGSGSTNSASWRILAGVLLTTIAAVGSRYARR